MPKKTINAKEILADIKAGMSNPALMEKYQLSEKGLQSLFEKLTDAGAFKQREPEKRPSEPDKILEYVWKCPACGKPQMKQADECPDCGVIVAKFREAPAKVELDNTQGRKIVEEEKTDKHVWKCSNCGESQGKSFDRCPACGVVGSKVKSEQSPDQKPILKKVKGSAKRSGERDSQRFQWRPSKKVVVSAMVLLLLCAPAGMFGYNKYQQYKFKQNVRAITDFAESTLKQLQDRYAQKKEQEDLRSAKDKLVEKMFRVMMTTFLQTSMYSQENGKKLFGNSPASEEFQRHCQNSTKRLLKIYRALAREEDGEINLDSRLPPDPQLLEAIPLLLQEVSDMRALLDKLGGSLVSDMEVLVGKLGGKKAEQRGLVKDPAFNEPLFQACREGKIETVEQLLRKGADVNARNKDDVTPLHVVMSSQVGWDEQLELTKLLFDCGADPNAKSRRQCLTGECFHSVLKDACSLQDRPDLVKLLLEMGADVNYRDPIIGTALHNAAMSLAPDTVKVLLENGADAHAKDQLGHSALKSAATGASIFKNLERTEEKFQKIQELLRQYGATE
jgi:rubrerythrin